MKKYEYVEHVLQRELEGLKDFKERQLLQLTKAKEEVDRLEASIKLISQQIINLEYHLTAMQGA